VFSSLERLLDTLDWLRVAQGGVGGRGLCPPDGGAQAAGAHGELLLALESASGAENEARAACAVIWSLTGLAQGKRVCRCQPIS
jgi:hypothetical protein